MSAFQIHKRLLFSAVAFLFLLSSCSVYKDVEVKEVIDVKFTEFGEKGANAEVYLSMSNPNWYKIKLTESHVYLTFEGKPMGEVILSEPITIPKKSVTTQVMKINASYDDIQGLFSDLLTLLFKSQFQLEAKGYVQGRALFVAKKVPIEFKETLSKEDLGF